MSLLANYYASIDEENAAKAAQSYAGMRLTDAQTNVVGANAAADQTLKMAQAGAASAQAGLTTAQAGQVAPNAAASRNLDASRTFANNVNTGIAQNMAPFDMALKGAQTGLIRQNITNNTYNPDLQGFAQGGTVAKGVKAGAVPGKGKPGPADTVPVMLAPGEGVLNKGAMEHYGTDVLDHMNAMGLKRMGAQSEVAKQLGLPDPHAAAGTGKGGGSAAGGGKDTGGAKKPASGVASLPAFKSGTKAA